jgi:c-di-GMP phosphodiesterase
VDVFVARQPIFDTRGQLAGYELLYRRGAQSRFADGNDSQQMSVDVVIQSFLEIGVGKITGGTAGFINFGREMLLSECYTLLDPQTVVVELLEDVLADADVEAACRKMVSSGYRLALDDFVPGSSQDRLLSLADIVKVDVLHRPVEEMASLAEGLRPHGVRLLAERVETEEVHQSCRELGFELFQGYFFSRPEIIANQGTSVEQTTIIQLLNLLVDDDTNEQKVEEEFRRDPTLSYKLLRMINTAAHGGRGVESIQFAIRLLGRGTLHRWLCLLLASSLARGGGTDSELVQTAVLRARFCEMIGSSSRNRSFAGGLFLTGIFSLMDAILRIPMAELVERVDLSDAVKAALIDRTGPYAPYLTLAEMYEAGDWDAIAAAGAEVGIDPAEIPAVYLEALVWARDQMRVAA